MTTSQHQVRGGIDTADVERRVIEIAAEEWEVSKELITRETLFTEFTDSLGAVELIMALEDEFEVTIPDEAADEVRTIGQAVDYILRHRPGNIRPDAAAPAPGPGPTPPGE